MTLTEVGENSSKIKRVDQKNLPFVLLPIFILGLIIGAFFYSLFNTSLNVSEAEERFSQSELDEIYYIVDNRYIGDIPDYRNLTDGLIEGLISSLDDRYAVYLNAEESTSYKKSLDPSFEGVGVVLKSDGENTLVESVLENLPAEKIGIKAGDIIIKVDGEDVKGKTPSYVASKIRGLKGTEVVLKLYRLNDDSFEELEYKIIRDKIEVENMSVDDLGEGIYKIDISQFVDQTPVMFNEAWTREVSVIRNPKGIIVDLRNNPGGYVFSVRYVLEEFLNKGDILLKEQVKNEESKIFYSSRDGLFKDVPLVVLVNEGSASASEIFATCIQDNSRGKVVGVKTVGKGVEQEIIENLKGGGMFIMPFQKWLSPNGRQVTPETPVQPDFEVEFDYDLFKKSNQDTQLDKAKSLISE